MSFNQHPLLRQIPYRLRGTVENKLSQFIETHIRDNFNPANSNDLYDRVIQEVEKPLIEFALEQCRGNQIKAARMLGINRNTLHKKIKTLQIQVNRKSYADQ